MIPSRSSMSSAGTTIHRVHNHGRNEGGHEDMHPLPEHITVIIINIYVFSFWGIRTQTPTGTVLLDPGGGLLSPDLLFCPLQRKSCMLPPC